MAGSCAESSKPRPADRPCACWVKGGHRSAPAKRLRVGERPVRPGGSYRRKHGLNARRRDERGRKPGHGRTLNAAPEKASRQLILDRTPDQLPLPFALGTRKAVGHLIQRRWGLRRPVRPLGAQLKRWGFTPGQSRPHKRWSRNRRPGAAGCVRSLQPLWHRPRPRGRSFTGAIRLVATTHPTPCGAMRHKAGRRR